MGNYSKGLFQPNRVSQTRTFGGQTGKPSPNLKGKRGGNCNRTACQQPGANYWHTGNHDWYCGNCANDINRVCRDDAMRLYGMPRIILNPARVDDAERAAWKAKGVDVPEAL